MQSNFYFSIMRRIPCFGLAFPPKYQKRRTLHRHHLCFSSLPDSTEYCQERIAATRQWFDQIVIAQRLCPFAPPLLQNPSLMRIVCGAPALSRLQAVELVKLQVDELMVGPVSPTGDAAATAFAQHETALVILDSPEWSQNYQDFVRLSWDLQEQAVEAANLVGSLQLVLFHPLASHQTYGETAEDSASDYTIRSPYPTVHLLREEDVLKAVQGGYPNLETLPARNQSKMMRQGLEVCHQRLEDCYHIQK